MALSLVVAASASQLNAQVYETDFSGFTAGNEFLKDFNISLGGDSFPTNFKEVDFEQWGMTNNGNDFAGGVAQPQTSGGTNNLKMMGVFLDPARFSGAGQYTISFDLTGDASGNNAYRAYVFAGSGYDLTGTTNNRLDLSLSSGGFGGWSGLTADGDGTAIASQLVERILDTEASTAGTSEISIDFTYDGSSAIAFAVGGYNNASTIDNFSVVPESGFYGSLAGMMALCFVLARRRHQ